MTLVNIGILLNQFLHPTTHFLLFIFVTKCLPCPCVHFFLVLVTNKHHFVNGPLLYQFRMNFRRRRRLIELLHERSLSIPESHDSPFCLRKQQPDGGNTSFLSGIWWTSNTKVLTEWIFLRWEDFWLLNIMLHAVVVFTLSTWIFLHIQRVIYLKMLQISPAFLRWTAIYVPRCLILCGLQHQNRHTDTQP